MKWRSLVFTNPILVVEHRSVKSEAGGTCRLQEDIENSVDTLPAVPWYQRNQLHGPDPNCIGG
jgi:hypothetical protein